MTAAKVEAAIFDLTKGLAKVTESDENLKVELSKLSHTFEKRADQLEERLTRHDQTLAEISTTLALLKKDVDDLKGRANEARKNRWALSIAILSALLSLGSAILVTFVKKS